MKKATLIFAVMLIAAARSFAQDVMTMKNGDEVNVKIMEVDPDVVKYKKSNNLDGPTYTESKSNIFMIKYKNGSKDVFKQESTETVIIDPEEEKKSHAVEKLTAVFSHDFDGNPDPILKYVSFKKTNGVLRNVNGQYIYEIDFELTIQFLRDGYKIGNGMVGYWGDFRVWPQQPVLHEPDSFIYNSVLYPAGTVAVLEGVADMESSDNGYQYKGYEIKKVGLAGKAAPGAASQGNTGSGPAPFAGFYNANYSSGDSQVFNNCLYYKSNSASVSAFSLNGITSDSGPADIKIGGNAVLGTFITIGGFRRADDKYSFTYSLCITLDNGVEFEKQEGVQSYNTNDPCIFSFNYNTPTITNGGGVKYFYMNFVIKDNNSDAIMQGYYKFSVLPQ